MEYTDGIGLYPIGYAIMFNGNWCVIMLGNIYSMKDYIKLIKEQEWD